MEELFLWLRYDDAVFGRRPASCIAAEPACVCVGGVKKAEPPSLVTVAPPLVVCIRFLIPRRRLLRTPTCMQLEFLYFCYFTCDRFSSSCLSVFRL